MTCNHEIETAKLIESAEIIAIGTEILMGQITNTNASFLAKELAEIGIPSYYQTVVGDNPFRLEQVINCALQRSDAVIMTGGLGPTEDDISMKTASKALGIDLCFDEESGERIRKFFSGIKKPMLESNLKQAMLPQGCIVINNNNGTAPGAIIEKIITKSGKNKTKRIILLPGPPAEMKPMYIESVKDYLDKYSPMQIKSTFIKLFGIGESAAEDMLKDIIKSQRNPTIAPYCSTGECMFRVSYSSKKISSGIGVTQDENYVNETENVVNLIKHRLDEYIYEIGNRSMAEVVVDLLKSRDISVSFAESCTAGLLTSMVADIPGASAILNGSIVCYSNQSKNDLLGVSQKTLEKYGAVSENTAEEMAKGCYEKFKSNYAVSVTGIAGPDGGTPEKVVGTVFISIFNGNKNKTVKLNLRGDRQKIRYLSALNALNLLRKEILNG